MEVISSFDVSVLNRPSGWCEVKTLTKGPYPRGGHSGLYIKTCKDAKEQERKNKIVLIGGADPDRAFDQTFVLDLKTMTWESNTSGCFFGRYEHSCYIPTNYPDKVYIFGGADLTGNRNDIQVLDTNSMEWTTVEVDGCRPSPRTQHHSAAFGDYLVVFGGGDSGANPVSDSDVHIFNATTQSWSILTTTGKIPSNRHGHAMVSNGNVIYVHGGMSGSTFYDDFFSLDMETCTWTELLPKGRKPIARAAHGAVAVEKNIFIFGGLCSRGALNELFQYDTVQQIWTKITMNGRMPSARLDFAMCAICIEMDNSHNETTIGAERTNTLHGKSTSRSTSSWLSNTISLARNDMGFFNCWCFSVS